MAPPKKKPRGKTPKRAAKFPSEMTFHYIKSNYHRVIHVDGAHGSASPHGEINLNLYSERFPIPQESTHTLSPEGVIGKELLAVRGKSGIIREVEASAVLSIQTAESLIVWLAEKVKEAKKAKGERG